MIPIAADASPKSLFQWSRSLTAWLGQLGTSPTGAVTASLWTTGDFKPWLGTVAPAGWLVLSGQLVAVADAPNLAAIVGRRFCLEDDADDFFRLPDGTGRVFRGLDDDAAAQGGSATIVLAAENLPEVAIDITDPGHTHTFTGAPHTHTATDAGHTHSISGNILQGTSSVSVSAGAGSVRSGAPSTLVTNTGHAAITVANATQGGTVGSHGAGISAVLPGDAVALSVLNPFFSGIWIIKT